MFLIHVLKGITKVVNENRSLTIQPWTAKILVRHCQRLRVEA